MVSFCRRSFCFSLKISWIWIWLKSKNAKNKKTWENQLSKKRTAYLSKKCGQSSFPKVRSIPFFWEYKLSVAMLRTFWNFRTLILTLAFFWGGGEFFFSNSTLTKNDTVLFSVSFETFSFDDYRAFSKNALAYLKKKSFFFLHWEKWKKKKSLRILANVKKKIDHFINIKNDQVWSLILENKKS